jgi:hypothetical protein
MDNFQKFKLLPNSKNPTQEWSLNNAGKDFNTSIPRQPFNFGIPCGKINNCFVVDLDFYKWKSEHSFFETFGKTDKEITKCFNTFTQKTAGGGLHLFFKYDPQFHKVNNKKYEIDIQTDISKDGKKINSYVVGAGSKLKFTEKDKQKYNTTNDTGVYTIINDVVLKPCPEKLQIWLKEHLYKEELKKKETKQSENVVVSNTIDYFKYNIDDKQITDICEKLYKVNPNYYTSYSDWIKFTTAMKSMNKFDIWDIMSQKYGTTYDKNKNIKIWNGLTKFNEYNCVQHIFKLIGEDDFLNCIKYKPIYQPTIKYDQVGEWDKLGKHISLKENRNYVIKSGTGTGKTTLTKNYFKDTNLPFISIVSRKTLAYEQYRTFNEAGIDCHYYDTYQGTDLPPNSNIIIQLDSIAKLSSYLRPKREYFIYSEDMKLDNKPKPPPIENYAIFLDEYSSLIEYLFSSPTLNKNRAMIYRYFKKIISNAAQIIAVDADINQWTMEFLKVCGKELYVINNTFAHNKGVPTKEYFKDEEFINTLKKKDKFLLCCDTKAVSLTIFKKFKTQEIEKRSGKYYIGGNEYGEYEILIAKDEKGYVVCITSETSYIPNLDEWDRVIFSPKIIYGLDSTMEREVFCYYKELTITPKAMMQQIARCRNIIKLNYMFTSKKFKQPRYIDLTETKKTVMSIQDLADFEEICSPSDVVYFVDCLSTILYNNDCYHTNKYAHFIDLLQQNQYKNKQIIKKTSPIELRSCSAAVLQEKIDNFDVKNPNYVKINEILKFDVETMKDNKMLFISDNHLIQYLNFINYYNKDEKQLKDNIKENRDFNYYKVKSNKNKLKTLMEFMKVVDSKDKLKINTTKLITNDKIIDKWKIKIIELFRLKEKAISFDTLDSQNQILVKMMRNLFGGSYTYKNEDMKIIEENRIRKNGIRVREYKFNDEYIKHMENLGVCSVKFEIDMD